MSTELFPCPCCGFLMFSEPPGSYDICELCGWEDDHVQLAYPGMSGGANTLSLWHYQQNVLKKYAANIAAVGKFIRHAEWRPLHSSEAFLIGAPSNSQTYFKAACEVRPTYYWDKQPS